MRGTQPKPSGVAAQLKRTEAALRASEESFRLLVEGVKDYAIFMLDPQGHVISWNQGAERIKRYRAEEILGEHFSRFYSPDDVACGKPKHALRMAEADGRFSQEGWRLRKDGSRFWANVVVMALRDADGNLRGFAKITQDISRDKAIEDELRASEARFRAAFAKAAVGFALTDVNGAFLQVNETYCKITGYTERELCQLDFQSITHPEDLSRNLEQLRQLMSGAANSFVMQKRYIRKSGDVVWVQISVSALQDGRGVVLNFIALSEDISDRRRAEEALRESEQKFRTLFEESRDAIFTSTRDGRLLELNPAGRELFGFSQDEIGLLNVRASFLDPSGRAKFQQVIEASEFVRDYEVRLCKKEGTEMECVVTASLRRAPDGAILGYQGIVRDVTERNRTQRELARLLEAERNAHAEAEILRAAGSALTQTLSLADVLTTVLDYLGQLVPYDSATVLLRRGDTLLDVRAARGFDLPDELDRTRFAVFDSTKNEILRRMFADRCSVLIPDTKADADWEVAPNGRHIRNWFGVPLIVRGKMIGVLSVDKAVTDFFTLRHIRMAEAFASPAATAIQNALDYQRVQQAQEELQRLSDRLVRLQDEERRRIARELHDSTAQTLAALAMNLSSLLDQAAGLNLPARGALAESLTLAEQCIREVRTLSYLLHPPLLDEVGLTAALRWYVEGFVKRSGIRVELDISPEIGRLAQELEAALFRIVQESLTNIHLHAGSPTARIQMVRNQGEIYLEIADEGKGMFPAGREDTRERRVGLGVGIASMRERAKQLGGRLQIDSGSKGTTVKVTLPLRESAMDER